MKDRLLFLFKIAVESVLVNKLRGFLTALGVVFGVAAVIAMLAIGSGAKKFILDQMRLIGTNNIVFTHQSLDENKSEQNGNDVELGYNEKSTTEKYEQKEIDESKEMACETWKE